MNEKKISENLENIRWQSQFFEDLEDIQNADEEDVLELLGKLKAKVQDAVCLEKIIVDFKDLAKIPLASLKKLEEKALLDLAKLHRHSQSLASLASLKELEEKALLDLGIGFIEKANLREPSGRNPALILLSRELVSRFDLNTHKRYLLLLVDKTPLSEPLPLKNFLAKLNTISPQSETLFDDIDAIIQWMDVEPSLERIIINQCFTEPRNIRQLEWGDYRYLTNLGITLLEQQAIQIPKGHNQPRISLRQDLIKNKQIDLQGDYFLLIIPQQIRLNFAEKYKDIIKVYEEMERKEENESMDDFIYSLSKQQILDLIEWRIDEFAESVNFILEPEYKAKDWEGKVLERIEHLRQLIIKSGDRGLAELAFIFIRQSINRRLLKERELAKSVEKKI